MASAIPKSSASPDHLSSTIFFVADTTALTADDALWISEAEGFVAGASLKQLKLLEGAIASRRDELEVPSAFWGRFSSYASGFTGRWVGLHRRGRVAWAYACPPIPFRKRISSSRRHALPDVCLTA